MTGIVKAELRKLLGTRMVWGFLALVVGIVVINVVNATGEMTAADLSRPKLQRSLFEVLGNAGTFVLILGAIGMTGEDRHKTITPSLLATPRRGRLMTAKLITYALAGVLFAAVGLLIGWAMVYAALARDGVRVALSTGELVTVALGGILYAAIAATMGVGLGAVLRNQVASVIVVMVYFFFVEALVVQSFEVKYTPGAAGAALGEPARSAPAARRCYRRSACLPARCCTSPTPLRSWRPAPCCSAGGT